MREIDRIAYPQQLEGAEAKLIHERRGQIPGAAAHDETEDTRLPGDTLGFGLSGGGIRSATFCLGLFQALAEVKLLRRVDFVSTVSHEFRTPLGVILSSTEILG